MSTLGAALAFFLTSGWILSISLKFKRSWSGNNYTEHRENRAIILIILAACFHTFNPFTEQIVASNAAYKAPFQVISLLLLMIQAFNLPTRRKLRSSHKQDDIILPLRLKPNKPARDIYVEGLFYKILEALLALGILATVGGMVSGFLLMIFIPEIFPLKGASRIAFFIFSLLLGALGTYRLYKKRH
jgi:MFS family permease